MIRMLDPSVRRTKRHNQWRRHWHTPRRCVLFISVDHPLYTFEFDKNALEKEGAPRVYGRKCRDSYFSGALLAWSCFVGLFLDRISRCWLVDALMSDERDDRVFELIVRAADHGKRLLARARLVP